MSDMVLKTLGVWALLLLCAAYCQGGGITLNSLTTVSCGAVKPVAFTPINMDLYEFHAWILSDNTIKFYISGQTERLLVTWTVPSWFTNMDSFRLNAVDPMMSPYPGASWLAANGTHIVRFQCGPSKHCGTTAMALPLNINTTHPVQEISELDSSDVSLRLLISADHVVLVKETLTSLVLVDSFTWSNYEFMQLYPASRLTGVVIDQMKVGGAIYHQVVMGFAANDVNHVGYVVTLRRNFGWTFQTMVYLPSSPQSFSAHRSTVSSRMIYYWLTQTPYTDANTPNAWVRSMGGASEGLAYASTVFQPGTTWSSSVFLLDDRGIVTNREGSALIVSGNNSTAGFNAWAPALSLGQFPPEVVLRSPTPLGQSQGYTLPTDAVRLYPHISLVWLGAVLSRNIHTHCWEMLVLDWAGANKRDMSERQESADYRNPKEPRVPRLIDNLTGTNTHITPTMAPSAPNCKPSTCNFEEPGDCPIERCWGDSIHSGFMCCRHPPV